MRLASQIAATVFAGALIASLPVLADEPAKAGGSPANPQPVQAGPVLPDIPENAAEIEALKAAGAPAAITPAKSEPTNELPRPQTARGQAFDAVVKAERVQLDDLQKQLDAATDADAKLDVQRRIDQVKQQTELDLLALQVRLAREAGQEPQAVAIEAAIEQLKAPRPVGVPQDRPVPADARR